MKQNDEENVGKIPYYATIYEPNEKEIVGELLGKHTRRIFELPLEKYTEYEKEKLIEYYEYCIAQKYILPKKNKSGKFSYPNIFRQLQGADFILKKASKKSPMKLSSKMKNYLWK